MTNLLEHNRQAWNEEVKKGNQWTLPASKEDIKKAMYELFKVKVERINTLLTHKGAKKAYIKLKKGDSAVELATNLGLL